MRPIIGITDFINFAQVNMMSRIFDENLFPGSERLLHIGVMMSYKTLYNIPNRWQDIFPKKENIAEIFSCNKVFNCIHFADYKNNTNLKDSLSKVAMYGGENLNAIQLDMIWPNPDDIVLGGNIEVILQIGKNALEMVSDNPGLLVSKLGNYRGIVYRVLLDKSMGSGKEMNPNELLPFIREIKDRFPEIGIIVAGGLGPDTLHLLEPLIKEFPDLSIDAQGKLRPSNHATDPIDWELAKNYLIKALKILK